MTIQKNRRDFLKTLGATACSPAALPLLSSLAAIQNAVAAEPGSAYRALVCVYLAGGSDSFNAILPYDANAASDEADVEYQAYKMVRPNSSLLIDRAKLNDTRLVGAPYALNPALTYFCNAYNTATSSLKLAIVGNVGPLLQPSTRVTVQNLATTPPKLFSHNDQTAIWLTGNLEGRGQGWGGGAVGNTGVNSTTAAAYQSVTINSGNSFCAWKGGSLATENFVADQALGVRRPVDPQSPSSGGVTDEHLKPMVQTTASRTHVLENAYANVLAKAYNQYYFLREGAEPNLTLREYPTSGDARPQNQLEDDLAMVANFIKSNVKTTVQRQVFFVQLEGFDSHTGTNNELLEKLNHAMGFFYETALGPNYHDCVTTFTASEFGRKLVSNGDGTDHGWGGHHFVLGGAVNNGIFGSMPSLLANNVQSTFRFADEQLQNSGALVPKVSVDQYAWELAKWLGVPEAKKMELFPNYFPPTVPMNFLT